MAVLVFFAAAAPAFVVAAPLGQDFGFGTLVAIENLEHETPVAGLRRLEKSNG
jgi:hypothetical protein